MNVHKGAVSAEYGASSLGVAEFEAFLQENPQVQYIDCVFSDLCGVVRGKRVARAELENVFRVGLRIPSTIYFLDARGDVVGPQNESDAADGVAWPVPGTLTRVNWSHRPHGQVLMTLVDATGEPYFGEPRNVLRRVVDRFAALDLTPVVALELQFYLLDRDRSKTTQQSAATDAALSSGALADVERQSDVLDAIAEAAAAQSRPAVVTASDAAPAQFNIVFDQGADPLCACDNAVFIRQAVRAIARQRGLDATFMAKPYLGLPGNAMHLRLSLKHAAGKKNVFDDGGANGSELLLYAIGGLQAVMAEAMALFAPNVNSYRRFHANASARRNKRWGYDNLTTNIRAPAEPGNARHIDLRAAGADANPYLALAAALAGIHHGVTRRIDPGQPFEGDAAALVDETMPSNIDAALLALENGSVMREYLGRSYVDLYCATKRTELDRFRNVIPLHEYDWYL